MNGHIEDLWFKTVTGPDGKPRRVRTARNRRGLRWRATYTAPDGKRHSQTFPDGHRDHADAWLRTQRSDSAPARPRTPKAFRITFRATDGGPAHAER